MGKVSKALAKFGNIGAQTGKSGIHEFLMSRIEPNRCNKLWPQSKKKITLSLFCVFLAGFILALFLSSVENRVTAEPITGNSDADQPVPPFVVLPEQAELSQTLPTIPEPKPEALMATLAGSDAPATSTIYLRGLRVADGPSSNAGRALSQEEEINIFLHGWKNSWEKSAGPGGDLADYFSYYASGFSDGLTDKTTWQRDKTRKNIRKSWIKVELEMVSLFAQPDGSIYVRFVQRYQSSNYSENSKKALILTREDGELKILSELEG